jgi:ABC-type antimicrobial peptide transport system permease subunit
MATAGLTLIVVAIVASYVPIRRLLAQNPLGSLRNE